MKAKYKKYIGISICIVWGLLCGILIANRSVNLITDNGSYSLIGAPVIASCMVSAVITCEVDRLLVAKGFFAPCHIPAFLSGAVFFATQLIIYGLIGLLIPWHRFKLKRQPAPETNDNKEG
jgi:hypothetical protein